jgi:outer membrane lipoprotein carrier protein
MKLTRLFVLSLFACFAASSMASAAPAANDVVDGVQKFYANITNVTATFKQNVHNAQFGTDKESTGTVWLKKPGKMRWDYVEKKNNKDVLKKAFISNGTTLFDVEPGNLQFIKKNLANDVMPVAVSFLYGKGDLKNEFNAVLDTTNTFGTKDDLVLKLTPKQPSAQYKNLYLVVDKTDFHAKESIIIDSSNNVNHFTFNNPDWKTAINDSSFEFDQRSVPNYQMIDADAPIKATKP